MGAGSFAGCFLCSGGVSLTVWGHRVVLGCDSCPCRRGSGCADWLGSPLRVLSTAGVGCVTGGGGCHEGLLLLLPRQYVGCRGGRLLSLLLLLLPPPRWLTDAGI